MRAIHSWVSDERCFHLKQTLLERSSSGYGKVRTGYFHFLMRLQRNFAKLPVQLTVERFPPTPVLEATVLHTS